MSRKFLKSASFTIIAIVSVTTACSESSFQGANSTKKSENKPGKDSSKDSSEEGSNDETENDDEDSSNDQTNSKEDDDQDLETSDESEFTIKTGVDGDCTTKENLVANSNFEDGNKDFKSYFTFDSTCKGQYSPGAALQYSINSTPSTCHIGYAASSGDKGKMLVVNFPASGQSETRFWCQTIKVVKGSHYKLSARLRAAVPSATESQPTEVTFTVNGVSVMATFKLEKDWKNYKTVEIPEASGDIVLCGESRTQNTESTDLIADDFTFAECKK